MRIGIITFHWATNYGAVLQTYAVQEYLKSVGCEVEIINYQPWQAGSILKYIRRPWLAIHLKQVYLQYNKEKKLQLFRKSFLNLTKRYFTNSSLRQIVTRYDIAISGSDQILNPSFTLTGEDKPTPTYYLDFAKGIKRIGYAVSFGCEEYPLKALDYAKQWIGNFDKIGIRESSGRNILVQMGYKGECLLVPDPTILYGKRLFTNINLYKPTSSDYVCVYILRKEIKFDIQNAFYIDDNNNPLKMEEWLGMIISAKGLITNSYHGMIMAILNHVPFVSILEEEQPGMNDRFETLLGILHLGNRICTWNDKVTSVLTSSIDWDDVDNRLEAFRKEGRSFLQFI